MLSTIAKRSVTSINVVRLSLPVIKNGGVGISISCWVVGEKRITAFFHADASGN